ncbi:hypothetical protein ES703_43467 [subsurface metagenome]
MRHVVKILVESEEDAGGVAAVLRTVLAAHAIECRILSVEKEKGDGK